MKAKSLLLSLMVISMGLAGCTSSETNESINSPDGDCWAILKTVYEWVTDDQEMYDSHYMETNMTYDSECRLILSEAYEPEYNNKWVDAYTYNDDGQVLSHTNAFYDMDDPTMPTYSTYSNNTYENGLLVSTHVNSCDWCDGTDARDSWVNYTYDNENRIHTIQTSGIQPANYLTTNTYDADGNLVNELHERDGNMTMEVQYNYSNGVLVQSYSVTQYGSETVKNYTHDASGNEISVEYESGGHTIYENKTYDDLGNVIVETWQRVGEVTEYGWDPSMTTRTTHTYGNPLS